MALSLIKLSENFTLFFPQNNFIVCKPKLKGTMNCDIWISFDLVTVFRNGASKRAHYLSVDLFCGTCCHILQWIKRNERLAFVSTQICRLMHEPVT